MSTGRVVLAVVFASGFLVAMDLCWVGHVMPPTYLPFRRYRT